MSVSCVVVLPTRNRSALAKNAIRSVLSQPCDDVSLLVSDNSTEPNEIRELSSFCTNQNHPRLRYIRPPQPLSMPCHWEFAVRQAETLQDASHVAILTDRMAFRDGMLHTILNLVAERPDAVLSYNDDIIHDSSTPVRLERKQLSGRVLELDAAQLLYLSSIGTFPQALPRMLNCFVPRGTLAAIRERFGDVFSSVAPDLCHAYRCLAIHNQIRYFDAPVLVQYGLAHSNGTGYYSGKTNDAWTDFNENAGPRGLTFAAPIPELCCNLNIVYHEYCFVRQQAGDDSKFPPVDWTRYVHAIAFDIHLCKNAEVREYLFALLRKHAGNELAGWNPPAAPTVGMKKSWGEFLRRAMANLRMSSPHREGHTFRNVRAALDYSNRTAPSFVPNPDHLGYLQAGWKLAG